MIARAASLILMLAICVLGRSTLGAIPGGEGLHYVIGLSPFLTNSVKNEIYRDIVSLVLEQIPLDSSVWVVDAYNLRTVTQIQVPNVAAFRSGKTRANQFKGEIQQIRAFLAEPHTPPESAPNTRFDFANTVRLPQFLAFVSENIAPTNSPLRVVVLGSPLYLDAREPGFSMVDGYFPSDGHLLATRERSVYGVSGRERTLDNFTLHFGYMGDPWLNEIYREKISRFWSLYLSRQGGRLATFTGDLPTLFAAARSNSGHPTHYELDGTRDKLEMLRVTREIGVADWITRDLPPGTTSPAPSKTIGPLKIGIRWRGDIDLDLYASARPGAETLFFEHTRSAEGYYFKDHRSSPQREYEFIEFESPVDVRKVEASINFYEGQCPGGPSGEVRVEFEGHVYTSSFSLPADHGNKGRSGRRQNQFWAPIDLPEMLHLKAHQAAAR